MTDIQLNLTKWLDQKKKKKNFMAKELSIVPWKGRQELHEHPSEKISSDR